MSIRAKLAGLAESIIDSLRTPEVQLPLIGLAWIGLHMLFPTFINPAIDVTPLTAFLPEIIRGAVPVAITPGWLIICLPVLFCLRALTPGQMPFSTKKFAKPADPAPPSPEDA